MNRKFQVRVQADPEIAALLISEEKYEVSVSEGENFQSSFWIRAEDESKVNGIVTSNNHRILFKDNTFSGTEVRIVFGLDTTGLKAGEKVEGSIMVISSLGEVRIPVRAFITDKMVSGTGNRVSSLEDFAGVCRASTHEGFRMFRDPAFADILTGNDAEYRSLYKGLSEPPTGYQNMEEFLVAAGLKEQVEISFDKYTADYGQVSDTEKDTLYIYRNTWGYLHMDIEVEGDFLEVSRKTISSDEFIGKVFALDYVIRREKLKTWKTTSKIRIHSLHQEITFTVSASTGESILNFREIETHRQKTKLAELLLDYELDRSDEGTWYIRSKTIIDDLCISYPSNAGCVLYKAYLAMVRGKTSEAMRVIWPIKDGTLPLRYQEERAAYLYIAKNIGLLPDEESNILPELEQISAMVPSNILVLYMKQSEESRRRTLDDMGLLRQLEFCHDTGCNSPLLYMYAWKIIRKNEAYLRKLTPFYMHVLSFAMRKGVITERAIRRCAFLSDNVKRYSGNIFRFLKKGYEMYRSDDILEAVCRLIIKGKPVRRAYFVWYERAIRRNLRITRIYEYYMETHDGSLGRPLPMQVLMYFAYNDTLSDKVKALLYASVITHRKTNPAVYDMFSGKMRTFAESSLEKGLINEHFTVLYREFFGEPENGRIAALMADIIFRHKIVIEDPRVRRVIVRYDALGGEQAYPVAGGIAYVNIYNRKGCILFEDELHRRFTDAACTQEKLMDEERLASVCLSMNVQHPGVLLYCCGENISDIRIDDENIEAFRMILEDQRFAGDYKLAVRQKLMDHYLQETDEKKRADFVYSMDVPLFVAADKTKCVTLLVEEGRFVEAFAALAENGYEHIDPTLMLRMTREIIRQTDLKYDEELLAMAVHVVRGGKYDEMVLEYMRLYYDGSVKDLCALRKMLSGFGMETYSVDEKILKQCVFAHTFPQEETSILKAYLKAQGNIQVITQYMSYICRQELMGRRKVSREIHQMIESCYERQWNLSISTQISLLKFYADMNPASPDQRYPEKKTPVYSGSRMSDISRLLETLLARNIRFGFYRQLPLKLIERYQLEDKVFIEEQFLPSSKVTICYRIHRSGGEEKWYREQMRDVYHGIFVKELLLFYGEKVTYYLEVTQNGVTGTTEEKTIEAPVSDNPGRSRYKLLNRMLKLQDEKDLDGLKAAAEQYLKQEVFVDTFLQLM